MGNDDNLKVIEQTEIKLYKRIYLKFIELNEAVLQYLKEDERRQTKTTCLSLNCQVLGI